MNIDFQLRPNFFPCFNSQNILNGPEILERYGSASPACARRYQEMTHGMQLTLGVKGTF